MEIKPKISAFIDGILSEMKIAIDSKNIEKVNILNYLLSQAQILSKNLVEIENRLIYLEGEINNIDTRKDKSIPQNINNSDGLEVNLSDNADATIARANAKAKRKQFLDLLKKEGTILEQYKGVVYKNPKTDGLVGIAFSSNNGGSWFLGLPDYKYEVVVLLCKNINTDAIVFPKDFYLKISDLMSRSRGHVKFNLHSSSGKYILYSKKGNLPVNDYLNNFNAFK